MSEYTLGEWEDGRRPMKDGKPMSDDEVLADLNHGAGLLEKLLAVGELPGKWREKYAPVVNSDGPVWRAAANELEALLKEGAL